AEGPRPVGFPLLRRLPANRRTFSIFTERSPARLAEFALTFLHPPYANLLLDSRHAGLPICSLALILLR
ncbi:unnamed protein product, partial [Amoebophrya sp. A120]